MYKLYGIKNCNTVKKAMDHLTKNKVTFEFVDFKKYSPTVEDINRWEKAFGDLPVNKQGLTYKKHKEQYEKLKQSDKINFIIENTSMIKRPILEKNDKPTHFGYDENIYSVLK
jgi:Spx/MgsR family transcriptional regulator